MNFANRASSKPPVFIVSLLPIILIHVGWIVFFRTSIERELRSGHDVEFASFPLRSSAPDPTADPLRFVGTYSDLFRRVPQTAEEGFDLIVVSATLNPVWSNTVAIGFRHNLMVRDAVSYLSEDPHATHLVLEALFRDLLAANVPFLEQLTRATPEELEKRTDELLDLCEPRFYRVPPKTKLSLRGVRWIAVVPLFEGQNTMSPNEHREKLAINVRLAAARVVQGITPSLRDRGQEPFDDLHRIRSIAFPALAGSELRVDSDYYLPYQDSFTAIMDGWSGRELPMQLERIYSVAWTGLGKQNPGEEKRALSGLGELYDMLAFQKRGGRVIGIVIVVLFAIHFLLAWRGKNMPSISMLAIAQAYGRECLVFLVLNGMFYWAVAEHLSTILSYLSRHGTHLTAMAADVGLAYVAARTGWSFGSWDKLRPTHALPT